MVDEKLRRDYWGMIRMTRQSKRVSPVLICRMERQWEGFDGDVVEEALRIHMAGHRQQKECYTLGIMRNLQRQRDSGKEGTGCRK